MRKTNRIISFLMTLIVLLLSVVIAYPTPVFADGDGGGSSAAAEPIKVSVTPQDTYPNGNAKATGNSISLILSVDRAPLTGGIVVSYHTEDYGGASASNASDYAGVKGSVTFTSEKTKEIVSVQVSDRRYGLMINGYEVNRTFRFVIDSVTVESSTETAEIEEGKGSIICQLPSLYIYATKTTAYGSYFAEYANNFGMITAAESGIDGGDTATIDNIYYGRNATTSAWKTYYVRPGYASIYCVPLQMYCEEDTMDSDPAVTYTLMVQGKALLYLQWKGEHETDGHSIEGAEFPYAYYDHNYVSEEWAFGVDRVISTFYVYQKFITGYSSVLSVRNQYERLMYIEVPDSVSPIYTIKMKNEAPELDRNLRMVIDTVLIDNTAPVIESCVADSQSVYIDGKFRFSIRFSEPVQVHGPVSIGVKFGETIVTMNYLSGSGTNVLTFETDLGSGNGTLLNSLYTKARLVSITGASNIGDFAYFNATTALNVATKINNRFSDKNEVSLPETDSIGVSQDQYLARGFSLDFRTPSASLSEDGVRPGVEEVASSRDFKLTLTNVSSATVYYSFDDFVGGSEPAYNLKKKISNEEYPDVPYSVTLSASGLRGEKFLHVKIVSAFNKVATFTFYKDEDTAESDKHGYYFSNVAPINGQITSEGTPDYGRTFRLTISPDSIKTGVSSDIDSVFIRIAEDRFGTNAREYCIYAIESSENYSKRYAGGSEYFTCSFNDVNELYCKIRGDSSLIGLENKAGLDNGIFYISFYAIDTAGNSSRKNVSLEPYRFDLRDTFTASVSYAGSSVVTGSVLTNGQSRPTEERVFDLSDGKVTFSLTDMNEASLYIASIRVGEKSYSFSPTAETATADSPYWKDAVAEWFTVEETDTANATDGTKHDMSLTVTPKKASYYEIILGRFDGGRKVSSDIYSFYITDGKNESTVNYEATKGNVVLNNRLFILTTDFWYMTDSEVFASKKYGGSSDHPVFGSANEARLAVTVWEHSDLYLVQLTDQMATFLENPLETNNIRKADGETVKATAGQWWIRYKRADWAPPAEGSTVANASASSGDWVYYYYCDGDENLNGTIGGTLPDTVASAIEQIADRVVKAGVSVNLVGTEYLNPQTGEPTVSLDRIHANPFSVSETVMHNEISSPITYSGDKQIYSNTVTVSGSNYTLASNLRVRINPHSFLYLKDSTSYTAVNLKEGATLRSLLPEGKSGLYTLLELDETGAREYQVYLDSEAPKLKLEYLDSTGEKTVSATFTSDNDGINLKGQVINIRGFDGEIDPMAYIVIYSVSENRIMSVLYNSEIAGGYKLENGSYLLEIGDRSGNIYDLNVMVCSEKMTAKSTVNVDQTGLTVTCNRDAEEIRRYEIRRNGEVVVSTTEYMPTRFFNQNGVYKIEIADIYGYSYTEIINFVYMAPSVNWFYSVDNGIDYIQYGPETDDGYGMTQTTSETGVTDVLTSGIVAFTVDSDVVIEITGASKNADYSVSEGIGRTQYTFLKKIGFVMRAYYEGHEDSAVYFNCQLETDPPQFEVTCRTEKYAADEMQLGASYTLKGGKIVPSSIGYSSTPVNDQTIESGTIVSSDYIRVAFSDKSGVRKISVLYNGELLSDKEIEGGLESGYCLFRESGTYEIRATDAFGNSSVFSFTNEKKAPADYWVDSETIAQYLNDETFGNTSAEIRVSENGLILLLIKYKDETGTEQTDFYFYAFKTDYTGGNESEDAVRYTALILRRYAYDSAKNKLFIDELMDGDILFKIPTSNLATEGGKTFSLSNSNCPYKLSATISTDGVLSFLLERTGTEISLEGRVEGNGIREPAYLTTVLSGECSDVVLSDGTDTVETNRTGTLVKTKQNFSVVTPGVDSFVTLVSYSFSTTAVFTDFVTVYSAESGVSPFVADQNGFYLIRIVNRYGNTTEYTIHRSDSLAVISEAIYTDRKKTAYDGEFNGTVRSNSKIQIRAFSDENEIVRFYLLSANGDETEVETEIGDDGWFTYTVTTNGNATFLLRDEHGVERTIRCSVTAPAVPDISELVIGFPEGADGEKGYSNALLSIDVTKISALGIAYIATVYNGETQVLMNLLPQTATVPEDSSFASCIGRSGDGDYVLSVRDQYGNTAERVLHYHGTDTLSVTRSRRNSELPESISFERIEKEGGLFSNAAFTLSTDASIYSLTVNGVARECPATFALTTVSGDFRETYQITYSDQYGFSYSFTAYLIRRTLSLHLSNEIEIATVDGVDRTHDMIAVLFEEENVCATSCVYQLSGGPSTPYKLGDKLREDGRYVFILSDLAGNETHLTVVRDTVCEYTFTEVGADKPLVCYGVATGSVRFEAAGGDDVKIVKAIRNGEEISNIEGNLVSGSGLWQILVEDGIGNTSYFTFYILTHAVISFSYETPYDFYISQIWQENGESNGLISRISYLSEVETVGDRSKFTIAENGTYSVIMQSKYTGEILTFAFTIDTTPPDVTLYGCNDGDITTETISLRGCQTGDRIQIYRNDKLVSDTTLEYDSDVPEITEGGDYRIVITNKAGATVTHNFYKKTIVNAPGSIFILIVILLLSTMLFVGLLLRNRSRVDK